MSTTFVARIATGAFALALTLFACKSSQSSAPPATFCSDAQASVKTCQNPTPCDTSLQTACADLSKVVSDSTVGATKDCLESGVCGVGTCLTNAQKSAVPSAAHQKLAADYCSSCAPTVADCVNQFYAHASKLPGLSVLPYADAIVSAIDAQCTGSSGCQAKFATCSSGVVTASAGAALQADTALCVTQALGGDSVSTGPGGTPQLAKCTADNCPGCCRDDECQKGDGTTACGVGGAGCSVCAGDQKCDTGACKEPCGPNTCAGCCDGDNCIDGTANDKCGTGGAACSACDSTLACVKQECIDPSCQASCTNGCCSEAGCQTGTDGSACGTNGDACVDCGFGRQCQSGACTLDPTSLWDFYVVSGTVPAKAKDGYGWDILNGLPDPYVDAYSSIGSTNHSGTTTEQDDTITPVWNQTALTGIPANELMSNLSFEIWDYDVTDADDFIGGCAIDVEASLFDGSLQKITCPASASAVSVTLTFRIQPHK